MRKIIFTLLLIFPFFAFGGEPDSLIKALEEVPPGTSRFRMYNLISDELSNTDLEEATKYALLWKEEARALGDEVHVGRALSRYGDILLLKGEIDSAVVSLNKSVEILSNYPTTLALYQAKIILARAYNKQLQYYQSLLLLNDCIDFLEDENNDNRHYQITLANAYFEKGMCYDLLNESSKGLKHLEKAESIYRKTNDEEGLANTLSLLAGFYYDKNELDSAHYCLNQARQIYKSHGWARYEIKALNNIAFINLAQGLLDTAEANFQKVLEKSKELGDTHVECMAYTNLASVYLASGNIEKAQEFSEAALRLIEQEKIDNPLSLFSTYKTLYDLNKKKGDFEKALTYFEINEQLKDSLQIEQNLNDIAVMESKLQAEQQMEENLLLKKSLEKETKISDLQTAALLLILLLALLTTIALVYFRRKNRQLAEKTEKLEAESTKLGFAVEEINSINATLEDKIFQRTKALTEANNQLVESERKARLSEFTIESSDFAVFWINSRGQFIRTNPACETLLGYEAQEFKTLRTKDIYATKEMTGFTHYWNSVKSERYFPWELKLKRKDGEVIWVESYSHYITFDNEEYICGFARDISERKQREKQISLRYAYESLIAKISNRLLNLPSGKLKEITNDILVELVDLLECDRAYVLLMSRDRTSYQIIYSQGKGGESVPEIGENKLFKGGFFPEKLAKDESIIFYDINELPGELKAEQKELQILNLRSLIMVPGSIQNEMYCAVGMHMKDEPREWTEDEENLLKIVGEIIASTLFRQQNERSLKESETRLKLALQAGNEAIWDRNLETDEFYTSEEFYELLGLENHEESLSIEQMVEMIHEEDRERFTVVFQNFLEGEQDTFDMDYRIVRRDGVQKWINSRGIIKQKDSSGKPLGITGTLTDINEQKQAELALEKLNRRLANLIENLPGIVYRSKNADKWSMEFLSNSSIDITGYKAELFTRSEDPKSWRSIIHPDDREFDLDKILRSVEENGRYQYTYRIIHKNEEVRWCLEQGVAIRDELGKIIEFEGYIIDITEKIKSEDKLIATVLETEDKERRRIAKELHDSLGQTLTAASLNINSLKKEVPQLSAKMQDKYNKTQELLRQAIKESRDISHNIMPKDIDDFGFALATQSLLDGLEDATAVNFQFYENLNGMRLPTTLELNLFRITQEAINNSLKYADSKNITVQLMKHDGLLILTIEDDGKGFNLESLKSESTSLGISNMRNRANAMSGEFTIDSSKSRGTIITVQILLENESVTHSPVFSR